MGDRYVLTVTCPKCSHVEEEVYYAPTCGFIKYKCPCGHLIDLEELSGISYEEASNCSEIEKICKEIEESYN